MLYRVGYVKHDTNMTCVFSLSLSHTLVVGPQAEDSHKQARCCTASPPCPLRPTDVVSSHVASGLTHSVGQQLLLCPSQIHLVRCPSVGDRSLLPTLPAAPSGRGGTCVDSWMSEFFLSRAACPRCRRGCRAGYGPSVVVYW